MQTPHMQGWSPESAAQSGPAHTWVNPRSWYTDIDLLRAEVTAAGWQWHSVEHARQDAATLATVHDLFDRRQHANTPRNTPAEPHILLAVGPDVPWNLPALMRFAALGRAHDVHLAVSATHRRSAGRNPRYPSEFAANIYGWYSRPLMAANTLACKEIKQ